VNLRSRKNKSCSTHASDTLRKKVCSRFKITRRVKSNLPLVMRVNLCSHLKLCINMRDYPLDFVSTGFLLHACATQLRRRRASLLTASLQKWEEACFNRTFDADFGKLPFAWCNHSKTWSSLHLRNLNDNSFTLIQKIIILILKHKKIINESVEVNLKL